MICKKLIQSMELKPNLWLVGSSLLFLGPCLLTYKLQNYPLCLVYSLVTSVSSAYHATKHPMLLYADLSITHIAHITTVLTILPGGWATMPYYSAWLSYAAFIYYYGHMTKTMVFLEDLDAATPWHMSLHLSTAMMTCYTVYAEHLHHLLN